MRKALEIDPLNPMIGGDIGLDLSRPVRPLASTAAPASRNGRACCCHDPHRARPERRGVALLGKAYEEHDAELPFLTQDAALDGARSDPRFVRLMEKAGLPKAAWAVRR